MESVQEPPLGGGADGMHNVLVAQEKKTAAAVVRVLQWHTPTAVQGELDSLSENWAQVQLNVCPCEHIHTPPMP